jgi:DNA-binding transcriptional ArsR family regulator
MPRIPKGKRILYVYIEESLYNQLKELAITQGDKTHGAISRFVENIIREYLAKPVNPTPPGGLGSPPFAHTHTSVNTFTQLENGRSYTSGDQSTYTKVRDKVLEAFNEVVNAYINTHKLDYYPYELPYWEFAKAIEKTIGSDPRTVDKWIDKFKSHGLIEVEVRGGNRFIKILHGNPKTETQES